jgi:mono/diheme cytochrome c family protein
MVTGLMALGSFVGLSLAASPGAVPYPEGYRAWQHVKSMVIGAGQPLFASFGGIHHLYANKAAMTGFRTGTFPDGSVIVFDLLEASTADGATTEGARKVVGDQAATACFGCHTAQAQHNYVFSSYRP